MRPLNPVRLIVLGCALLLFGFLSIFSMVIRIIEPSFALSFLAYGSSFVGLLLGLVGVALHSRG